MPIRRNKRYRELNTAMRLRVQDAVDRATHTLQLGMKQMLSQPGRGRMGKQTRASAPGQPPAAQTGHLRGSVQVDLSRLREANPRGRAGTNVMYGLFLEMGTRKMAPRPWARPTARKLRASIRRMFTAENLLRGIK
jgi:hypothetical protein